MKKIIFFIDFTLDEFELTSYRLTCYPIPKFCNTYGKNIK